MIKSKKLYSSLLVTVTATLAQFNSPVDPLSLANTEENQQNRTISSNKTYNALSRAGMPVGLIDIHNKLVSFEMGICGQKVATSDDSTVIKDVALTLPRFTVGAPGRVAFTGNYGIIPMRMLSGDSLTLYMPQHRFGIALAAQAPDGVFRVGFNLDGFGGKSAYEERQDSGRAILGAENIGLSFGTAPHKYFSMDLGVYTSGYIDTLFGTKTEKKDGEEKMIRQERIAEIELPRVTTNIRVGDTSAVNMGTLDFTYGKKHFVYAVRNGLKSMPAVNDEDPQLPNLDPIITDSIRWNFVDRLHFIPVEEKVEVNPSFSFGYMHNRYKRMNPGKDNQPMDYNGEDTDKRWETSSFRFGFGLDLLFANCIDYWNEYDRSNMKLNLTGKKLAEMADFTEKKKDFNRYATGAELAFHNIPPMNFPESGELFFNLSFQTLQESGLYDGYGTAQYKHLEMIGTDTQIERYTPWVGIQEMVTTNDFTIGMRGSFNYQLFELGGRIHFLKQTTTNPDKSDPVLNGPKYGFRFVYNLTEKARVNRVK